MTTKKIYSYLPTAVLTPVMLRKINNSIINRKNQFTSLLRKKIKKLLNDLKDIIM